MGLFDFNRKEKEVLQKEERTGSEMESILLRGIEVPTPKEQRGEDYVLFGQNNSFPKDLLEYRNTSAIHDAIIEGKEVYFDADEIRERLANREEARELEYSEDDNCYGCNQCENEEPPEVSPPSKPKKTKAIT